jgi:hypothetical protein
VAESDSGCVSATSDDKAPRDLDAPVRRASRIAEEIFKDRGSLSPLWLIEMADGKQEIIVSPILAPDGSDSAERIKEQIISGMRRLFRERGVQRYVWAMEIWTVDDKATDVIPGLIHEHPDRKEAIVIQADDGFRVRMAFREIIRTGAGVYLGKLKIQDTINKGRFSNLLGDPQQSVALN